MTGVLPDPWVVVRGTDWLSLDTGFGPDGEVPRVLARLLGPDLTVEETGQALGDLGLRHQNTIYEATVPAALCIAAVLARRAERYPGAAGGVCVLLLEWLADVAHDFDAACPPELQKDFDDVFVDGYTPVMAAVRALRPALHQAVAPFLDAPGLGVADTALSAALAFAEHPGLAGHRDGLAGRARRLLLTSDTRWRRRQALDALTAWGHDTTGLTRPGDDNRSPYVTGSPRPGGGWDPGDPPF
ncbi:hypothetical protein ABZW30_42090 [Kitasatospora sp. NPDC004669]|uniref:hypothetical protein n=1 Tax=Kitasatospora sp. NPDC004669 TaxID=3154555 RepID=UPI0033A49ACE